MASLSSLPFDVIEYILYCDSISYIDICRLSSVSKMFNCFSKSNTLWRKKYSEKWPEIAHLFDDRATEWKSEFRFRIQFNRAISKKLSELAEEYYHQENVSNDAFHCFRVIAKNHPFGPAMIINELGNIINHPDSHLNLTEKYYAQRSLRYMRHEQLEREWRIYMAQPDSIKSLVEGSCLISQWCQPTAPKCTGWVKEQIEDISRLVLQKIKELFPNHPVVKEGVLKRDVIPASFWSIRQCKDVLYCINTVLFEDLKFVGNDIDYYSTDTTFIDKVLLNKSGVSMTLGIIYSAIAAKLGVALLSVNFPGHFLLKWLEHPGMDAREGYTFIDVVEKGAFKTFSELSNLVPGYDRISESWTEAVSAIKVFIKLAWYLVEFGRQTDGEDSLSLCNALELLCLLKPDDTEHQLLLARLYMHLGINRTMAISMLQEIAAHDEASELTIGFMYQSTLNTLEAQRLNRPPEKQVVKGRDKPNNVKYAVGMIMRHKKYNFRCVIYGWDYNCKASTDWKRRMGVNQLLNKSVQPFYYVLVEDGTNRYAAQENLQIDRENKPISHAKIGRYFESYHGSYFLPNKQTLLEYPQDIEAREKALLQVEEVE